MHAIQCTRSFFKGDDVTTLLPGRYPSKLAAEVAAVKLCLGSYTLEAGEVGRPIYEVVIIS